MNPPIVLGRLYQGQTYGFLVLSPGRNHDFLCERARLFPSDLSEGVAVQAEPGDNDLIRASDAIVRLVHPSGRFYAESQRTTPVCASGCFIYGSLSLLGLPWMFWTR